MSGGSSSMRPASTVAGRQPTDWCPRSTRLGRAYGPTSRHTSVCPGQARLMDNAGRYEHVRLTPVLTPSRALTVSLTPCRARSRIALSRHRTPGAALLQATARSPCPCSLAEAGPCAAVSARRRQVQPKGLDASIDVVVDHAPLDRGTNPVVRLPSSCMPAPPAGMDLERDPTGSRQIRKEERWPTIRPRSRLSPERNPNFTGRGKLLQVIRRHLAQTSEGAVVQAKAVHEAWRVGKTQSVLMPGIRSALRAGEALGDPLPTRPRGSVCDRTDRARIHREQDRVVSRPRGRASAGPVRRERRSPPGRQRR
jgi:hypothetical protein